MKKFLSNISDFITDPEYESDVGGICTAFCCCGIVCWLIMYFVFLKGMIPPYIPPICIGVGIVCNIIWYLLNISNDVLNTVLHYFYAILCLLLYGVLLFVIPIVLVFIIFTAPIWICTFICEIRERGAYGHKKI